MGCTASLERENAALKKINADLERKLTNITLVKNDQPFPPRYSKIMQDPIVLSPIREALKRDAEGDLSAAAIDAFVEKLLADPAINIAYLPDAIERQIYRNVFTILMGILKESCNATQIQLLGHTLSLAIHPVTVKPEPPPPSLPLSRRG
jgi:hypothetical protein